VPDHYGARFFEIGVSLLHVQVYKSVCSAVIGCLIIAGCGRNDGPARVPLQGMVTTTDIESQLRGTIALLPTGGTKGPAANGLIQNGIYQFDEATGPVAGEHRVIVDVQPPQGKLVEPTPDSALQWKFEFQIKVPATPPYVADFQLIRENKDESAD
jgi:hypothetical protein